MTASVPRGSLTTAAEPSVIALARDGDRGAFDELVRRRQANIRRLLMRLSGHAALSDDLAQETFLQAWRRLDRLRLDVAFGAWLRQIAVNVWLQHVRRAGPTAHPAAADAVATTPGVDAAIDLDRALSKLEATERVCVVLSYGEGMSHSEIASATSLPLGTVKTLIARGSRYLREQLAGHEPPQRGDTE